MEPTEENRRAWDAMHRRRSAALTAPSVSAQALQLLPPLDGRRVLHLFCGAGETSAQLVARGAIVTGIDLDEEALATARERAPEALFLRADLHHLPAHLRRRRFDLLYASPASIRTAEDLGEWARAAAGALRQRGELFAHALHPVAECVDPATLRWRADYFEQPRRPGDLVAAVIGAGLSVVALEELRPAASPRRHDPRVPGELVLRAVKP
jgi:SAM-dependent methyltransferase